MTTTADELRVPIPLYRHAAPSAPWPWMDFKRDKAEVVVSTTTLVDGGYCLGESAGGETNEGLGSVGGRRREEGNGDGGGDGVGAQANWRGYPQSLFGNWTRDQVERCRMFEVMGEREGVQEEEGACMVYGVDVRWRRSEQREGRKVVFESGEGEAIGDERAQEALWKRLWEPRSPDVRLQALFVERMSTPAVRMLGTRYNVEPFFFASSANWIPSRYQEDLVHDQSDHITIVLPFVRVVKENVAIDEKKIDTQVPLHLSDDTILLQDLLAFHMVRTTTSDTILSYHPDSTLRRGSATLLRSLMRRTGDSVYWSYLYKQSKDPTIVLLALLWHAVYAWDEALEVLYDYLNKTLEGREFSKVHSTHTRELHQVRAHLIYYKQLLWDFRATITFVKTTANPAMSAPTVTEHERKTAAEIHCIEADNLLAEVERLENQREMQANRVANAMSLAVSTVKNEETRARHHLTGLTMKDSATTKQISYFTLVFLPGYYMAGVFRMNVKEVNPHATELLAHYIEGTVIFMLITTWLVVALLETSTFHPGGRHYLRRVAWPVFFMWALVQRDKNGMEKGKGKGKMRGREEAREVGWRWMTLSGRCRA